jgi:hypothetical protein
MKILVNKSTCNNGSSELTVPGFGLPIDFTLEYNGALDEDQKEIPAVFRHGVNDFRGERLTMREIRMLHFMDIVMDKPDWQKKIFDTTIVDKWKQEILKQPQSLISERSFEWCLLELRDKAKFFEEKGFVLTFESPHAIAKSDSLVSDSLKCELKAAVESLYHKKHKDWHPRSNDQVLNLVHPSLYPLVYGRSQVLRNSTVGLKNFTDFYGKGEVVSTDQDFAQRMQGLGWRADANTGLWSENYQWLPCETQFVGQNDTAVRITSYINNLHPIDNAELYPVIERFISLSIPLWNEILNGNRHCHGHVGLRIHTNKGEFDSRLPSWAGYFKPEEAPAKAEIVRLVEEYLAKLDNPDYVPREWDEELPENWEEEWGFRQTAEWKWKRMRKVVHPEPNSEEYESWKEKIPTPFKLEHRFQEDGLQIIVKLASIELTPEKPDYAGGNWHLEGMSNEHIVATSIYYYDVENVTDARISFRAEAFLQEEDLDYEQDEHGPLEIVFGASSLSDGPAVQDIGSLPTKSGRILAFPNTLQHKVEPFSLQDKTKPGHRRFLVLWLVDPHYRIMSTANVAPQQREWWAAEVLRRAGWKLPTELAEMVIDAAAEGWLMDLDEAKDIRLKLMDERVVFGDTVERRFQHYCLCEH